MNHNEEVPDFLGGLGDMLPADVLKVLNELLEQMHRKDKDHHGSHTTIVYVAPGAQYVGTVENQYLHPLPGPPPKKGNTKAEEDQEKPFDTDTPLSALFHKSHHEELIKIIESWRPHLIEADPEEDALRFCSFHFDFSQIRPATVYLDFAHLINHEALQSPMSVLAAYMFQHSNLSKSENALYVQLKRYKKLCE
jgi:hypothetical protein